MDNVAKEAGLFGVAFHSSASRWKVPVLIESSNMVFKMTTGADETVISEELFAQVFLMTKLQPPRRRLQRPDSKHFAISGMASMNVTVAGNISREEMFGAFEPLYWEDQQLKSSPYSYKSKASKT